MKLILDVKDSKAAFFLELLKNLPFVKAKTISANKAALMEDIKEAVEEMNLIKAGKLEARDARELLNEI